MIPIQDTIPSRNFPIMNWVIIGLNAVVFWFQLSLGEDQLEALFYQYGVVPARYAQASAEAVGIWGYFPFLSSMFLHGGWGHFLGNMWSLYIFGDNVEDRMGPRAYLLFYVLSGLAAGFLHYYLNMFSQVPAIGASGAIAGVMGAYLMLYPGSRIIFLVPFFFIPYFFEIPAFIYLSLWFLGEFLNGTSFLLSASSIAGGIAFWAHVGGFLAGLVLYRFFIRKKNGSYQSSEPPYYQRYRDYYSDF
ncbi:MAG: rhomboid family intramembrane serine protease [Bacteroidetes bacterium]|nr:MAG: rhomboid family intramembrane serine protease [Bacteroidota bacterium]